jgi:hypothetical protein
LLLANRESARRAINLVCLRELEYDHARDDLSFQYRPAICLNVRKFEKTIKSRRFNVPQAKAGSKSIGDSGLSYGRFDWPWHRAIRLNTGLHIKRKYQSFQAFPAQLPNFGLPKSTATHRAAWYVSNTHAHNSMLSIYVGDGDSWRIGDSTGGRLLNTLVSATRVVLAAGLYRVSTAPLRNRSSWCSSAVRADTVQGLECKK